MTSGSHDTAPQNTEPSRHNRRPHLVMAVGNLVIGDSRVEKAAISARDCGYMVTVVGVRRRTVQQVSFIDGDIPVIRVPIGHENHDRIVAVLGKRDERLARRRRQINGLPKAVKRPAYLAHRSVVRSRELGVRVGRRLGRSWRALWPHLVDYEAAFFDAFTALEPDILHVHDRHPLPGAAKYARWATETPGVRSVSWLYDAHEFVPTQHLPPPVEHQQAWIGAESDCIRQADAVVTVTEEIGEFLRRRHRLRESPTILRNLPSTVQADRNVLSTDVRTAAGLSPDVPLAVYAGGITPQRGVGTLLDAQSLIPGLHVAVICKDDGELRGGLREQAKRLGTLDRVHLLDYVPASHVSRFLSTADVGISALLPSPAHQAAAPTKVSEYLHARLPVVVSDMRAQAERVRRLGFGKVYPSGDPTAMAEALSYVVEHAAEFKERITDQVILENAWEADIPGLESVWARLSPGDRQVQPPRRSEPSVVVLRGGGEEQKVWDDAFKHLDAQVSISATLPHLNGIEGDLTDGRFMVSDEGQRFLDFWREEVAPLQGVFYPNPVSLVDGWAPALTTGILSMSGKSAIRLLGAKLVFDVDRLRSRYPDHWLHEIPDREVERLRSEFAELRNNIRENDRAVVTSSLTSAWSLGNTCAFIPAPSGVANLIDRPDHQTVRLGWFKGEPRSERERTALENLHHEVRQDLEVTEVANGGASTDLSEFDIVVDALSSDLPTADGLRAIAAGCALLTGRRSEPAGKDEQNDATRFLSEMPVIHSVPAELHAVVSGLLEDRKELADRRERSRLFANEHLSQSAVASRLLSLASVTDS